MKVNINSFPDVVRIEPVGKCNFKCLHCPTGVSPNNRELLKKDQFHSIIDQFSSANFIPRVVVLYHGGESTLNKNLTYYIQFLKDFGVSKTVVTTNASLLTDKLCKELILAGLDELKISFDGTSAEENDALRVRGDFVKNANNVKTLVDAKKSLNKANPTIKIGNIQICDKEILDAMFKQVIPHNPLGYSLSPPKYLTDFFGDKSNEMEFRSYPAMVWPGFEDFTNYEPILYGHQEVTYCSSLFETVTILSNGDVVMCCYDLEGELVIGNAFKDNIFDIWNSDKYTKIRNDFTEAKYTNFCSKCNVVSPRYLVKKDIPLSTF